MTVAGTVRRTFALLGRDLPAFVGLALILGLLPRLIGAALSYAAGEVGGARIALGQAAVVAFLSVLHRGAAVGLALPGADGSRRSLGAALAIGLALFLPNLGILLAVWIGVGLASVLLLVPGVMLLCRWIVALPIEVAERPGVRGALARSRDLTGGHRWRIFGLLALYGVASGIAPFLLLFQNPRGSSVDRLVIAVTAAVVGAAVNMVGQVGVAAIYAELRGAREAATSSEIVEAFG